MTPGCDINFSRRFSLPFGIAPHELSLDDMGTFIRSLDAGVELLNNTFTKFTPSQDIKPLQLKKIKSPATDEFVLPFHSSFDPANVFTSLLTVTKNHPKDVVRKAGNLKITQTTAPGIAAEFQAKVVFNTQDFSISVLPVPFHGLDTMRVFWIKTSTNPLTTTLGIDTKTDNDPPYLLETYKTGNDFQIGELNRLLLRSPLTGTVRFEPYYHFRWKNNKLETVCPSNSGRLIIKAFNNSLLNDSSETRVYEENDFIIENVDRESAHAHLFKLLSFNIENFRKFASKENDAGLDATLAGVENLYAIDTSGLLYAPYKNSVAKALKTWVLFKKNVNSNTADTLSFTDMKAGFPKIADLEGDKKTTNAKTLGLFLDKMAATAIWKTGFSDFLKNYYVPLLSGMSWAEVRKRNTQDDSAIKFPVGDAEDPKNKTDAASKEKIKEHRVLEGIYNDTLNAILCYSGSPLGLPSRVYNGSVPAPVVKTMFPSTSLSLYEVEAVHLAEKNVTVFPGLIVTTARVPTPGMALDISEYDAKSIGYSASFELKTKKHFYTFIDFLQELLKEVNGFKIETPNPILDTYKYYNSTDATKSHPLLTDVMNFSTYKLCESVRDQIAELNKKNADTTAIKLGSANLKWWIDKVDFITDKNLNGTWPDGLNSNPRIPYMDSATRTPPGVGDVPFAVGMARTSGFDLFDLESLHTARPYIRNYLTSNFDMPLPVILTIILREGLLVFSWLTRITTPKTDRRFIRGTINSTELNDIGRIFFLSRPYGLDTFIEGITSTGHAKTVFDEIIFEFRKENVVDPSRFPDISYVRKSITERVLGKNGNVAIKKLNKRVHWQFIFLMLGWYQYRHERMKSNKKSIHENTSFTHTHPDWFINDYSDVQGTVNANDVKRKDFITYYSLVYLGYNANPAIWNSFISLVESASRAGLSVRDFLVFRFKVPPILPTATDDQKKFFADKLTAMSNMIHFAAGLDAFSRIIYDDTNVVTFDTSNPNARAWGV